MSVTPNEIRNAQFSTTMRGYNRDDVDAFLQKNADALEAALTELNTLRASNAKLTKERQNLTELEETLKATLVDARTAAKSILSKAGEEAKRMIFEAEDEAKRLFVHANERMQEIKTQVDELTNVRDNYRNRIEETIKDHLRVIAEITEEQPDIAHFAVDTGDEEFVPSDEPVAEVSEPAEAVEAVDNNEPAPEETPQASEPEEESADVEEPAAEETEDEVPENTAAVGLSAEKSDGSIYERSFVEDIVDITPVNRENAGPVTNQIASAAQEAVDAGKLAETAHNPVAESSAEDLEFYRKLSGAAPEPTPAAPQPAPAPAAVAPAPVAPSQPSSDPTANLRGPDGIIVFGRREDRERAVEKNAQVLSELDSVVERFAAELSALEKK